ncbi:MAG: ParB/RepB/Spo0J family partition protein [Chloroflexi bacterium]|nr:ParB/RepB/Spo0J family partition protein [Chloroflexota bacterium]OJV92761.1 MAG: hypothetical protein BGO39_29800 [Chloroflexi bacterium 54-19]
MTKKTTGSSENTDKPGQPTTTRSLSGNLKLPGSGIRRDLKETWGNIKSKAPAQQLESSNSEARLLNINRLSPNPNQPRKTFDASRDAELAADIQVRGILEPIIARAVGEDDEGTLYQIVAGERRYRAALSAGLTQVPIIVKNFNDTEARFTSLVENLQRLDLDPLDEAYYFQTLSQDYNYSYREIARMVNRSPAYVSERVSRLSSRLSPGPNEKVSSNDSTISPNDSEISNNRSESEQKLQNSQMTGGILKPVYRFRDYLDRTRQGLVKLKEEERTLLANEIGELKRQLGELEEELARSAVSRETPRKTSTKLR